jgi:hypothetical protein
MAKYSELTEKEKNDLAQYYARELHAALYPSDPRNQNRNPIAFGFGGTVEDALRMLGAEINKYGKAGSVDLINRISKAQATVKGSDFINEALNPNLKGTRKEAYFPKGLRQAFIKDLSDIGVDDESEILSLFSYADDDLFGKTAKEQIAMRKGDISKAYTEFSPALETEQGISDIAIEGIGIPKVKSDTILKAGQDIEGPPREAMGFDPSAEQKEATKAAEKADLLKTERDKQAALAGTDGAYGYRGGYEQFLKDQQILAPTRLGKTEPDGSFRLRTPAEVQARIREGQFNIQEPKREALRRFRDRFGGFQQERKQFMEDTGEDPLEVEKRTTAGQQQMAAQAAGERERQKREMLDKQFKVQEPIFGESPFLKDLSPTERAEVLRMVKEKEEKAFGTY